MSLRHAARTALDRHAAYSMADQVVVSGLNFAVGIVAARLLGVADFGLFSFILMLSALLYALQDHFLLAPMMTLAGARRRCTSAYFNAIRQLGIVCSSIAAVLITVFLVVLLGSREGGVPADLLLASALLTFAQNQQLVLRRVFFAEGNRRPAVVLDVLRAGATVGLVGMALAFGLTTDVTGILTILAASALLAILPFSGHLLKVSTRRQLYKTVIWRQWAMARWLLLFTLAGIGRDHAIWIITGIGLGDEALGGLRAGQYLLGVTHFVMLAMENFIPRAAAREKRDGGHAAIARYLGRQMLVLGVPVGILMILLALFAEPVLAFAFGAEFAAFGDVTRIFALIYLTAFGRRVWESYLRAVEDTRSLFVAIAAGSAVGLIVIYPAMHQLGVIGAALTMLLAEVVCLVLVAVAVVRHARSERVAVRAGFTPGYSRARS